MSRDRYSTSSYSSSQQRSLLPRLLGALLIIVALTLLLLSRSNHPFVSRLRAQLLDLTSPAVEVVSAPVTGARAIVRDKRMLVDAYEENKKLHAELDTLREWQSTAVALKAENEALRSLAGYKPVEDVKYITARITGQSPSGYSSSLMINAGSKQGIATLQPVVDAYGLIGRVTDVGERAAKVLLLSDSSSRIPVVTADARVHAILAGSNEGDELMRMTFLGGDSEKIAVGEQVVTTEEGGLIPGGIAIGTVFRRDAKGLLVKPSRPLAQSEYIRVIAVKGD